MARLTSAVGDPSRLVKTSASCLAISVLATACGSNSKADPLEAAPPDGARLAGSSGQTAEGAGGSDVSGGAGIGGVSTSGGTGGASSSEGNPDIAAGLDDPPAAAAGGSSGEEPEDPPPVSTDERPFFSFFVTSQAGMYGLPAGQVAPEPDPVLGYGGDFGGLAGADEICGMLARAANPGDTKTWRAFLSTAGLDAGEPVDAIDRIGPGPWYNYNGLELAANVAELLPQGDAGRPRGADPELADMFTDENGEDIRPNSQVDNHDTLTGSGPDGRLYDDGEGGGVATCEDWTSNTLRGDQGNGGGNDGQVPVGHSWPRSANNGRHWIQDHTVNGCEPGSDVDGGGGVPDGDFRVGAGGGFGGIYCFALGALAPE